MSEYSFQIVNRDHDGPLPGDVRGQLLQRPGVRMDHSLAGTAANYRPDAALEDAINTSIAVGEPLLLTGEPGTGKTQAAYFVGHQLGVDVFHFQVKSDSTANDLLYDFDTVRYFHEAHLAQTEDDSAGHKLDRGDYVEKRKFWLAMEKAEQTGYPVVLLIDEVDKAPRDFPNDLLHELDQMEFTVKETGELVTCKRELRPLLFITSNDERRLPPAFLRRCVSHCIELTDKLLHTAVMSHRDRYPDLDEGFLQTAINCFVRIRRKGLHKPPATGELLVWLEVLSAASGTRTVVLDNVDLKDLPYLGTLIKHPEDKGEL